jgi:hypothetical protein
MSGSVVRLSIVVSCVALAWTAGEGRAQDFPTDGDYEAFACGDDLMTDGFQDEPGALAERDVVGELAADAAGLRAVDEDFLYLRIRLDQDPDESGIAPFAWGVEFDLDGDLTDYEIMVMVDGIGEQVSVFDNTQATPPDDPTDPPDQPPVATYPYATHGRSTPAGGSSFGGDADFFLDFAAAWADLEPLGLAPSTPVAVWVASSSSANALDGDFACHDGGAGDPTLSGTASDTTEVDPDGIPPVGDTELEGGGGCSSTGSRGSSAALLLWLALLLRRHYRLVGASAASAW